MSRITVEDCLNQVPSRFELVMLASKRARQLFKGAKPLVESDNREVVVALREIAADSHAGHRSHPHREGRPGRGFRLGVVVLPGERPIQNGGHEIEP